MGIGAPGRFPDQEYGSRRIVSVSERFRLVFWSSFCSKKPLGVQGLLVIAANAIGDSFGFSETWFMRSHRGT